MNDFDPMEDMHRLERSVDRLASLVDANDRVVNAELENVKIEVAAVRGQLVTLVPTQRYVVVERIVFGLVALTLTTVFAAMLAIVVRGG